MKRSLFNLDIHFLFIVIMIFLIAIAVVSCFHNSIGINVDFDYLSQTGDDTTPENVIYDVENAKTLFENYIRKHNKKYKDEEEYRRRYEIFVQSLIKINERNRNSRSEIYGITQFADMTLEEFYKGYTGLANYTSNSDTSHPTRRILDDIEAPEEFDWREKNVVSPVKDQMRCGSCWAFSAAGLAEGQHAIKHGQLLSLSEQQLVDCLTDEGGCYGGLPHTALSGVSKVGGLMKFDDYPYTGKQGTCAFRKESVAVKVRSGTKETINDEEELKKLVYTFGPVSIGIVASEALQAYTGKVYIPSDSDCPPDMLADHAVLIVGYGSENGTPYWIIKNSWGEQWGENGYFRIIRGKKVCAITTYVATGDIA